MTGPLTALSEQPASCDAPCLSLRRCDLCLSDPAVSPCWVVSSAVCAGPQEEHNKDNILPKLMASTGNYDAMFTAELAKYQPYVVSRGACLSYGACQLKVHQRLESWAAVVESIHHLTVTLC